jgi:23S rRNA pseudouridine2605 synthase
MISGGRVQVDGHVVRELGVRIDPSRHTVHVEGKRLQLDSSRVYLAFNKPAGVVSTMSDESGRPSLADYVGDRKERLFHVGRLDSDTEGLILLTNDGDFAHRMAHPSYEVAKTYVAEVSGAVGKGTVRRILSGVHLDDGMVHVDSCTVVSRHGNRSIDELALHEGRNRVVRRLMEAVGHPVRRLTRTAIGPVRLHGLGRGELRELTREELGTLLDAARL